MSRPDGRWVPPGAWIVASAVLLAPQPVDGPYPHVCGHRRECWACGEMRQVVGK